MFQLFKPKKSDWMRGLLFAERVGPEEAYELLYRHEWADRNEFEGGVIDYLRHHARYLREQE